jgi:hypothetical protein
MTREQVQDFVDAILNEKIENMKELIEEGFDINVSHDWPMGCVGIYFPNFFKGCKKFISLNLSM